MDDAALWLCLGYLGLQAAREWRDIMRCKATVALEDGAGVPRARHWMLLFKALMTFRRANGSTSGSIQLPMVRGVGMGQATLDALPSVSATWTWSLGLEQYALCLDRLLNRSHVVLAPLPWLKSQMLASVPLTVGRA